MKKTGRLSVIALFATLILGLCLMQVAAQDGSREGRRRGTRGDRDPQQMLDRMDENKDGKISSDEFRGPGEIFSQMDADKDGSVTLKELKKARPDRDEKPDDQSSRGERGPGRRFDPSRMQERWLERIKETLGSTDEEWTVISPLVKNVLDARANTRMVGFGRRRGDEPEQNPAAEALKTALESENPKPGDIKAKLDAFRKAREEKEQSLKKARGELKKVLTVKQEGNLVLMGILD